MNTKPEVLIVDDELTLRDTVSQLLRASGFQTDEASGVHEALAKCKKKRYAAIVSDIQMPGENGIALIIKLKMIYDPLPPIFLMTGFSDVDAKTALGLGVAGVFSKPFSITELIQAIRASIA